MTLYEVKWTSQFKKGYQRIKKRGYDISKLEKVVELLANGKTLPEKYKDHKLLGTKADSRECHIAPDWLLEYQVFDDVLVLMLIETGTHSDFLE